MSALEGSEGAAVVVLEVESDVGVEVEPASESELKEEDGAAVVDKLEKGEEVEEGEMEVTGVVEDGDKERVVRELGELVEDGLVKERTAEGLDEDGSGDEAGVELGGTLEVDLLLLGAGVVVVVALDEGEVEDAGEEEDEAAGSGRDDPSEVSHRGPREAPENAAAHLLLSLCSPASLWTAWRTGKRQLESRVPHLVRCSVLSMRHSSSRSWKASSSWTLPWCALSSSTRTPRWLAPPAMSWAPASGTRIAPTREPGWQGRWTSSRRSLADRTLRVCKYTVSSSGGFPRRERPRSAVQRTCEFPRGAGGGRRSGGRGRWRVEAVTIE